MPDRILNYDIISRVGEGAGTVIYAVSDPQTGQLYALKHVVCSNPKQYRFIEQMEVEFEVSRQFNHPNLRKVFELKINRTLLRKPVEAFMLMELVDGMPLSDRPPAGMLAFVDDFIQVAHALRAMHALGFVHCDLKPTNILVTDKGLVKLIDFGQSCRIGTVKPRIQGTPDFIAPEQVNRQPVTVQTDVYNLGATIYVLLTKKPIPTLFTTRANGRNSFMLPSILSSPQELNPEVPTPLSNLVMDSIATTPSRRPAGMDEIIARLELTRHVLTRPAPDPGAGPTPAANLADATAGKQPNAPGT